MNAQHILHRSPTFTHNHAASMHLDHDKPSYATQFTHTHLNFFFLSFFHSQVNKAECALLEERWVSDECMAAIMKFMSKRAK